MKPITINVDGGAAGTRHVGIAAVARSPEGYFIGWLSRQMKRMTNNEAEYYATLLGLDLAEHLNAQHITIISDSEVVVRQMSGISRVNSQHLRRLHTLTCARVADFKAVNFQHVKREENALADALATEAISGRLVRMPPTTTAGEIAIPSTVKQVWERLWPK